VDGWGGCEWRYGDLQWDLRGLKRERPQRDYTVARDGWLFYLNVCGDTVRVPKVCSEKYGEGVLRSPGYQTLSKDGETACYYMGNVNTGVWGLLDESRPEEGLKLTYSSGTKCDARTGRSLEYHFVCDPRKSDSLPTTVAGECRFMVIWETSLACPLGTHRAPGYAFWGLGLVVAYCKLQTLNPTAIISKPSTLLLSNNL